jgi:trimeric autotransporter adhesin
MKRNTILKTILFIVTCFALCPMAKALVPPPDGGYPGGNTAEGQGALSSLTTGTFNTAVGLFSLTVLTDRQFNTAVGAGALLLTQADENTATGAGALLNSSGGFGNTANGAFALFSDTDGDFNTATGDGALFNNTTASNNTALGFDALASNSTGGNNTAIGSDALSNSTGFNNVAVGVEAGSGVTDASNVICIGAFLSGLNEDNSCFISNIFGAPVGGDAVPVLIDSTAKLGTFTSSRRFKKEIKPMEKVSEAILSLKPVAFHYKSDNTNTAQFGLIAEEVAEVNPDLVIRDKEGKPYTVRYDAVNAMLLNEFLKQHRTLQELKQQITTLTARLKEQDSKIQKISDQSQLRKPGPRVVDNNR